MKVIDQYHQWVEWSEEDQVYIGKCPDLITGIHGDDPVQLYKELCETLEEIIDQFQKKTNTCRRLRWALCKRLDNTSELVTP